MIVYMQLVLLVLSCKCLMNRIGIKINNYFKREPFLVTFGPNFFVSRSNLSKKCETILLEVGVISNNQIQH